MIQIAIGILIFIATTIVTGDYYTSVVGLEDLLSAEGLLIDYLENYMQEVHTSQKDVETIFEEIDGNLLEIFTEDDAATYFENPLNAFKAIRRLAADWPKIADTATGEIFENEYSKYMDLLATDYLKPTSDDLQGASKGLVRLQETYALITENIAQGILREHKVSAELSAGDCFEVGRYLMETQQYARSAEWLIQSKVKFAIEQMAGENNTYLFSNITNVRILEHLAPVLSLVGNHKLASKLNAELLANDPNNKFGLENGPLYRNNLLSERRQTGIVNELDLPSLEETVIETKQQLYEKTCRGELRRTPNEERSLRCRYTHNNVPFCLIAPFKMEELNSDPFVAQYHDVIYDSEIESIIGLANTTVERSKVGDVRNSQFSDIRTSKNTWLWFQQNDFMKNMGLRLTDITGLSLESGEALQVANYGIGGHYGPHHDFMAEQTAANFGDKGNRILTALFYINSVEMGGGTAFPYLRFAAPPIRRSLIIWFNLHESLEPDYRTLHAGCPVLKGSKWICNEWFHESGQEFRRPCSLEMRGHKSLHYKDKL